MNREGIVEDYLNDEIPDSQLSKEELFNSNTGLVYFVIKTYYSHEREFEYQDLVQMGMVGTIQVRVSNSQHLLVSKFGEIYQFN